ncbi:hypothetical protein FRC07_005720 [Ceratobasidium sp. 392]|nr:hypothetical protein FRC07_005720 [Ceratobasidium sp. 392]
MAEDEDIKNLAEIWPTVTRLETEHTNIYIELEQLHYFTKLPRLQYLALNTVGGCGFPGLILPSSPSHTLETLATINASIIANSDVGLVAQYMLPLWPNLQQVQLPDRNNKRWYSRIDINAGRIIKALDSMIGVQRGLCQLKSRIVEEYGLDAMDKLLK